MHSTGALHACLVLLFTTTAALHGCGKPTDASAVEAVFGRTGLGPGELSYPRAAVITSLGRLYVVDKAARVQAFTFGGESVLAWRMPEFEAGKPTGLATDAAGRIYAADTHYSRVMILDPNGAELARFGSRGTGPGQFILPTDVVVDRDGNIFVSEYSGNDRISKFSPDYKFLLSFGRPGAGPGEVQRPQALAISRDNTLWVADAANHRICHFNLDGEFLGCFGQSGSGLGELYFPYSLDFLSDGTLVVVENGNSRLQRFDTSGRSLGTWGAPGRKPGELAYPWAAAVGPDDRIYVIDSGNNRVQVINGRDADTWRTAPRP